MMNFLRNTAFVLVLLGALNWGLVGLFNFDLVAYLFGQMTVITRILYTLIGISAVGAVIGGNSYCRNDVRIEYE